MRLRCLANLQPSPRKFSWQARWTVFILLALFGLALRLPQLGVRPMHTDESINAYIIGQLLAGDTFHYDPRDRHGPALAAISLPLVRFEGAKEFSGLTEAELRLIPVLAGTATVLIFGAGVEIFGFIPCVVAALLFAAAPLPVYYSRYFIHETLFVAGTLGLILTGWSALARQSLSMVQTVLAAFCAAWMFACKETAVVHFAAFVLAAFVFWLWRVRRNYSAQAWWQLKQAIVAIVVFLCFSVVLFTWFGQNWKALPALLQAIPNFSARAGGEGHEKPSWYYLQLLIGGWSGAVISFMALIGLVETFRKKNPAPYLLLALYTLLILGIYSAIPYKTPWLALNLWLPFTLFAGFAVESLWRASAKPFQRGAILVFLTALGILIAHDTRQRVFIAPADEKNPYAYAHTSDDLLGLPVRLDELMREKKIAEPRIAVIAADPWPLPWYLRKYSKVGFWQPGQKVDMDKADFFLTSTEAAEQYSEQLKDFRPEFFGVRPGVLIILWSPATT